MDAGICLVMVEKWRSNGQIWKQGSNGRKIKWRRVNWIYMVEMELEVAEMVQINLEGSQAV